MEGHSKTLLIGSDDLIDFGLGDLPSATDVGQGGACGGLR
jgi:hypothetical protein